ncbi:MAG: hypothetical protein ACW981_06390 [Candidatus Hodarchaeales archaeon]|jgi:hypothetical protein
MNVVIKVDYRYYEPNKGLEEIQAQIFNDAIKKYDGNPTTVENIRNRYESEDFDPKTVRYAFDEHGKPLGYVSANPVFNLVYLGYPWAVKDCPHEVQDKLFTDMRQYAKEKFPDKQIVVNVNSKYTEVLDFVKARDMKQQRRIARYQFKVDELAKVNVPTYKKRFAEAKDLPLLLELMKKEPGYENFFPTDAERNFFKERIEEGETLMIYDEDELVSCVGPGNPPTRDDNILLRFSITNVQKMDGWKAALVEFAKHYVEKGHSGKNIVMAPDLEPEQIKFYDDNNATIFTEAFIYNVE